MESPSRTAAQTLQQELRTGQVINPIVSQHRCTLAMKLASQTIIVLPNMRSKDADPLLYPHSLIHKSLHINAVADTQNLV